MIAEAGDKLMQVQEEMGQLDMDLEDNMSERNQKYRELKKREETMDAFTGSLESNMEEELERLQSLGEQITRMLSTMSSNLETDSVPAVMKDLQGLPQKLNDKILAKEANVIK